MGVKSVRKSGIKGPGFNRLVLSMPAPIRFVVDHMAAAREISASAMQKELVTAGLKTKEFREEYEELQVEFREHVQEHLDAGESSEYFIANKNLQF